MTPKSFVQLGAVAVVSALLAILAFAANNQWSTGAAGGEKLMPGLADTIRSVVGLEVRQGEDAAVLERSPDGRWSLKSRDGYPVDIAKVRALLVGLGQAELVEPKTGKADRYAALELEDPARKGAKSRLVRLMGADGKALSEVVLGKRRVAGYGASQGGGTYVRRPGNPQTWLANVEVDAPVATKDWVKTSVLSLDIGKINRVSIEIPGEQALRIERRYRPRRRRQGGCEGRQGARKGDVEAFHKSQLAAEKAQVPADRPQSSPSSASPLTARSSRMPPPPKPWRAPSRRSTWRMYESLRRRLRATA
jgi:hypothetical protein